MRKLGRNLIFTLIVAAVVLSFPADARSAKITKNEYLNATLYTQTNMWNEQGKPILSVNYHRGDMIPVGTEVRMDDIGRKVVKFTVVETGRPYSLILSKKHSKLGIYDLIDRYFDMDNPKKETYKKFSKKEKKSIDAGIITAGMSKNAVLMAYGYPPTHRTPTIEGNVWNYWESRIRRFEVFFENGEVVRLNGMEF